jgi:penicillin-binding protein 2
MIQNHHSLVPRLNFLWILFYLAGTVLGLRVIQLQILQNVEYSLAAERNRSQIIYQAAPRGRISDRNGVPIATNIPAFSAIYMPGKRKEKVDLRPLADELAKELNQDPEELHERLQQAVREETAIRLAENLPQRTMFRLSELKTIYPGVDLIVEARRYYPFGHFASHLLGYMGKMDARAWKDFKIKGYRPDARIGKLGLESLFEPELRGRDGGIRMEVDAHGRLKRILERIEWQAGSNIRLTLDAVVQKAADEALRTSVTGRGAIVALDPRSGAILALSSAPDFDPNALLSSDPGVVRKQISDLPEFNYAIAGTYPPGSIFKPIQAHREHRRA